MPSPREIKDTKLRRRSEEDKLARDIIDECRVQLMLKFRFLDLALWRMEVEPLRVDARYPLSTDAEKVYIDPPRVIARYQASDVEAIRDYLHMVMHCIFRHPFDANHNANKQAWWLACDILVEGVVMDMCGGRFESPDDRARRGAIDELKVACGNWVPGRLYRVLDEAIKAPHGAVMHGIDQSKIAELHGLFERDNHEAWPSVTDSDEGGSGDAPGDSEEVVEDDQDSDTGQDDTRLDSSGSDSADENVDRSLDNRKGQMPDMPDAGDDDNAMDGGSDKDDESSDAQDDGHDSTDEVGEESDAGGRDETMEADADDTSGNDELDDRGRDSESDDQQEKDWEEIAKQIEMNLETFSKEWGDEAGSLISSLAVANRKVYDYSDFLRRFMTTSEEMKVNQDEFDYIYYTYGLDLYGDMPLVEPLEYKETQRVRDFVIAVDTSESVSGELVKRFIEHTFEILKESQDYASEVNVHIVQCDSKIQADTKVTDTRDIDKLMEKFYIRGYGGTDFRPVFDYVETLRDRGELADMRGLLYFTDGLGEFPDKTPDYDVAFVFMDTDGKELPPVPPWAMKVVIDEEGINRFKSKMRT